MGAFFISQDLIMSVYRRSGTTVKQKSINRFCFMRWSAAPGTKVALPEKRVYKTVFLLGRKFTLEEEASGGNWLGHAARAGRR
jgi:hypothetical protein